MFITDAMAYSALLIASLFFIHFSLADNSCSASSQAIAVPIRNVTVSSSKLQRRGIALSIGTNPQPLAFELNGDVNDTYVWAGGDPTCLTTQCVATRGGIFEIGESSSWLSAANMSSAGASNEINMTLSESAIWGTDLMALNSNSSLTDYPLGIVQDNSTRPPMNELGLGRNSTILNALMSAKMIGSRTWGLFWGWLGADQEHQLDGSIVFGGYDAGKVTGNNITIPFSQDNICTSGYIIEITDISMILVNGSTHGILDAPGGSSDVMRVCIEPDQPLINIPFPIYENFLEIAGGTPASGSRSFGAINFYGMLFEAEGVYTGDLSFTVSPGLTITVPNHQLVVPDYTINEDGVKVIQNNTTREILLNSLQGGNEDDLPKFGWTFLSGAYLLVDEDKQQFTLWQNNAQSGTEQLVALGPTSTCTSEATTTAIPGSANTAQPTASSGSTTQHSSSSTGAIVGGVVGGAGAIALGALGIFLLRRRVRKSNQSHESENSPGQRTSLIPVDYDKMGPQELPLNERAPAEIDSKQRVELEGNAANGQTHTGEVYEMMAGGDS